MIAGNNVETAADEGLQSLATARKLLDMNLESSLLEQAEFAGQIRHDLRRRLLSGDAESHWLDVPRLAAAETKQGEDDGEF